MTIAPEATRAQPTRAQPATPPPESARAQASPLRIAGVVALLVAILVAFLVAFAMPTLRAEPRDVPIALVAPAAVAAQLTEAADAAQPDAVAWTTAPDAAAAEELIRGREVSGALILSAEGLEAAAPSAAGASMSAFVRELGERVGAAAGLEVTVSDPVPFTAEDPRGVGLSAGALPIALGGWIAAVGIIATVRGGRARILAALSFAVAGGTALTAVLRFWFGTFDGSYPALAAAGMLGIAATSLLVLGLQRLAGGLGIACAAVILILLGNPLSGLGVASELLPAPWGELGQWLPPGATGALLRNTGFFDPATVWAPALILAGWAAVGAVAFLLGGVRERRAARGSAGEGRAVA